MITLIGGIEKGPNNERKNYSALKIISHFGYTNIIIAECIQYFFQMINNYYVGWLRLTITLLSIIPSYSIGR